MEIARCSEDQQDYTASLFAQLQPNDLERKRRQLSCPACGGPAFFRKATRNGRAACFGARPHSDDCDLAAQDHTQLVDGEGADLDALNNPGERIVVDLNFGAQPREAHVELNEHEGRPGRAARYVGQNPRPDARMHRRLSSLLRTLIEAPHFRLSQQVLELNGRPDIRVCDFFVPLLDIDARYSGQFKGWWGLISDARQSQDGTLWLNSGGRDTISFCVPPEFQDEIFHRYRIEDFEDFAGSYLLVLGELRISQYGKLYCIVESPSHASIRLT